MITDIKKHSKAQQPTEVVEHIASILQGIALDQLKLSYTMARLCKSNAERSYALMQNKHLIK